MNYDELSKLEAEFLGLRTALKIQCDALCVSIRPENICVRVQDLDDDFLSVSPGLKLGKVYGKESSEQHVRRLFRLLNLTNMGHARTTELKPSKRKALGKSLGLTVERVKEEGIVLVDIKTTIKRVFLGPKIREVKHFVQISRPARDR